MPPLPSPSTNDYGHADHDIGFLELPMFDDALIWPPSRQSNSNAIPLNLAGVEPPLLPFAQPPFTPAPHGDPLLGTDFRRDDGPARGCSNERATRQESPAQLENALLLFSKPSLTGTLLDEHQQPVQLTMTAEMSGMFFVAENIFSDEQSERRELTCYRRNLWQCLGVAALSQQPRYVIDEQGNESAITQLMASITAQESISGNPTDIVSTSWKTTDSITGNAVWAVGSPSVCPFPLPHNTLYRESDSPRFKMAWTRLQFKHSTANNGRRKGPQQHYVVQIHLHAETATGRCLKLAEIHSSPVIVRGRSPRNFESQKEIPVSCIQRPGKRPLPDTTVPVEDDSGHADAPSPSVSDQFRRRSEEDVISRHSDRLQSTEPSDVSLLQDRHRPRSTTEQQRKRLATSPGTPSSTAHTLLSPTMDSADVLSLSLFEDEPAHVQQDGQSPILSNHTASAHSVYPDEEDDAYYEYFPLTADDWFVLPILLIYDGRVSSNGVQDATHRSRLLPSHEPLHDFLSRRP